MNYDARVSHGPDYFKADLGDIVVIVTRSASHDKAHIVFVDTTFEPNDSEPGLRVNLNDSTIFATGGT